MAHHILKSVPWEVPLLHMNNDTLDNRNENLAAVWGAPGEGP
jgi:hypothetical protein